MSKWTPGPWEKGSGGADKVYAVKKIGGLRRLIASVAHQHGADDYDAQECGANADLIAAAPDLLRELKRAMDALGGECYDWGPARAVVAKALGA